MSMPGRFFGPGEVRLAILSLLGDEPMHGYELMRRLEERSGGIYQASAGTIYPTLQMLDDQGLIAAEARDGKRVYRLTEAGRDLLRANDESVRRIWNRAQRWAGWRSTFDPDAAELRGPAERLVKAAFRSVAQESSSADRLARVRQILERALRDIEDLGKRD
jgi:DNA-binding PadR family transcriptional regulator